MQKMRKRVGYAKFKFPWDHHQAKPALQGKLIWTTSLFFFIFRSNFQTQRFFWRVSHVLDVRREATKLNVITFRPLTGSTSLSILEQARSHSNNNCCWWSSCSCIHLHKLPCSKWLVVCALPYVQALQQQPPEQAESASFNFFYFAMKKNKKSLVFGWKTSMNKKLKND